MKVNYSIIVPIYNEIQHINRLLSGLKPYYDENHEIIIINDGSNDGSLEALQKYNFIKLLNFKKNQGKGIAIKKGLQNAIYDNIIIFDGDLELNPSELKLLMILNLKDNITCVFANRYAKNNQYKTFWDYGNYFITIIFNIFHKSKIKDALCCAKSFFKNDIIIENLSSNKFDIDVEITSKLIIKHNNLVNINMDYKRRNKNEGKKLKLIDTLLILKRIILTPLFNK